MEVTAEQTEVHVRRVAPNVRTGAKYCALPEWEADRPRTEGQMYTLFYMLGLLGVPPTETIGRLQAILSRRGARDLDTCSIAEASAAIEELAAEVRREKDFEVLPRERLTKAEG
jgi:hypothetical protein